MSGSRNRIRDRDQTTQDSAQGPEYRTGYNAVHRQMHRPGCRQQTADSRQQTDEQDQIQMTGP